MWCTVAVWRENGGLWIHGTVVQIGDSNHNDMQGIGEKDGKADHQEEQTYEGDTNHSGRVPEGLGIKVKGNDYTINTKQNNPVMYGRRQDIESKNAVPKYRKQPECKSKDHYDNNFRTWYGRVVQKTWQADIVKQLIILLLGKKITINMIKAVLGCLTFGDSFAVNTKLMLYIEYYFVVRRKEEDVCVGLLYCMYAHPLTTVYICK